MSILFSFIVAALLTMVLIPPLVRFAAAFHMADVPGERKVHKTPMPRLGGLAMVAGVVLPLLMWAPRERQVTAWLCGVAILLLFGIWDDIRSLDYRTKFAAQFAAVLVVVLHGGVVIQHVPFAGLDPLPSYIAIPLTVLALVGITNAINLADGLDGLAGGISLLSLAIVAVLAYLAEPGGTLVLLTATVMGGVLGFLRFNTYPARIFMGDGGSQFLGFSAGVLVVVLTQQANTALSPALPLMILGLPILDTVMVMIERIYQGQSPFVPDKKHLHHRLLALGFDHYEAVFVIYALQSTLIVATYPFRYDSDALIVGLYLSFCLSVVGFIRLATVNGWRMHRPRAETGTPATTWVQWLRHDQRLLKGAFRLSLLAISAFLFSGALFVESVPKDIGALALGLLTLLLVLYFKSRHKPFNILERTIEYIVAASIVYLIQMVPAPSARMTIYCNVLLAIMTVSVVIGFRFAKERFRVTPTDFLVVFIGLAVPNLPGMNAVIEGRPLAVAMVIVLFYCIELVLNNVWRRWDVMRLATCGVLAVLAVRGVTGA